MSRYTVERHGGDVYILKDNTTGRQWACNQTEARIMEFAFNGVAEGYELRLVDRSEPGWEHIWRGYTGPTKGIAP